MATTTKPRISDEAVEAKTGKTWSRWFKHLDAAGAKKMTHQEIVAHLRDKHDVRPWWQQMVAVTYEQARGLRERHEKPGGYEISVSRTINAPVDKVFKAWTDEKTRIFWLRANFKIRKLTANKTLRIDWNDGTDVVVAFYPKGDGKCQVVVQHGKLKGPQSFGLARRRGAAADTITMKKFWGDAIDELKDLLVE